MYYVLYVGICVYVRMYVLVYYVRVCSSYILHVFSPYKHQIHIHTCPHTCIRKYSQLMQYGELLAHWEDLNDAEFIQHRKNVLSAPFISTIIRKVERLLDQVCIQWNLYEWLPV